MLRTAQAQQTIEPAKPVTVMIFYGCRIEPGQWRRSKGAIVRIVESTPSVRLLPRPGMAPYVAVRQSVSPFRDVRNAHEAVRAIMGRFSTEFSHLAWQEDLHLFPESEVFSRLVVVPIGEVDLHAVRFALVEGLDVRVQSILWRAHHLAADWMQICSRGHDFLPELAAA